MKRRNFLKVFGAGILTTAVPFVPVVKSKKIVTSATCVTSGKAIQERQYEAMVQILKATHIGYNRIFYQINWDTNYQKGVT